MEEMTTDEMRAELAQHELSAPAIEWALSLAQELGDVELRSPATGSRLIIAADDDAQVWTFRAVYPY